MALDILDQSNMAKSAIRHHYLRCQRRSKSRPRGDDLFTAFSEAGELDFKFLSDSSSQIYRFRLDGYNPNEIQFQP